MFLIALSVYVSIELEPSSVNPVSQMCFFPCVAGSSALRASRSNGGMQISPEHSVWCMICYLCSERPARRRRTNCDQWASEHNTSKVSDPQEAAEASAKQSRESMDTFCNVNITTEPHMISSGDRGPWTLMIIVKLKKHVKGITVKWIDAFSMYPENSCKCTEMSWFHLHGWDETWKFWMLPHHLTTPSACAKTDTAFILPGINKRCLIYSSRCSSFSSDTYLLGGSLWVTWCVSPLSLWSHLVSAAVLVLLVHDSWGLAVMSALL